jgi:hypothetical protein
MIARVRIATSEIRRNREINPILRFPISVGAPRGTFTETFSGYGLYCEGGEDSPGSREQ